MKLLKAVWAWVKLRIFLMDFKRLSPEDKEEIREMIKAKRQANNGR